MQPLGFHITMRLRSSAVLAAEATAQRRLALALLKAARHFELLAFRAADDYLHLLTTASPAKRPASWRAGSRSPW